jgi:transcription-repair coupling factor (superfamily II helicase)
LFEGATQVAKDKPLVWHNLHGCADALLLAETISTSQRFILVICSDTATAIRLEQEVKCFLDQPERILAFPDWETLTYDLFSPLPEIISQRLHTLSALSQNTLGALLVPVMTLMHRIAPRDYILANSLDIRTGQQLDSDQFRIRLESVGYQCVSQVLQHGEFALRGAIIDLFPMGSSQPYRIELFDDEVETIRTFDPETQRSSDKKDRIELFPGREFPFDDAAIKQFRQSFRQLFPDIATSQCTLYQDVSKGIPFGGIEYYQPLFVEHMESLLDYLPAQTMCVFHHDVGSAIRSFTEETRQRYLQRAHSQERPILPPEHLFLGEDELLRALQSMPQIRIGEDHHLPATPRGTQDITFHTRILPPLHESSEAAAALAQLQQTYPGRILFVAESAGQRESMLHRLAQLGIRPVLVEHWRDYLAGNAPCSLLVAALEQGVMFDDIQTIIITEQYFTGSRPRQRQRRSSVHKDFGQLLKNLEELAPGTPVVHRQHGVGRYLGLQHLNVGGIDTEFLALQYAGQDKLYVPVASLHLISRYGGAGEDQAPLHKLGGEQWSKARRRALERVRDVAADLLDIYARRAARVGRGFDIDQIDYPRFASQFPFEETPDQASAIIDVVNDLHKAQPMDRVVCGDVGFGKTEVAMRAAFVVAANGAQVAVLVPTTLLAQQHFKNFSDRFADWPVRVEVLSRFISAKDQKRIMADVAEGKVDILIGTHKLLQGDLRFRELGLVIIDEEHRFGVNQKEHFKKLRSELDFLTLTATPIPRTLDMAMSGLRDISIIATPPQNRHVIRTFITEWNDLLVQEAMLREIRRGGQVYFLHNKIETLEKTREKLLALVPEIRAMCAHGQMAERELESIMLDFYHQRFNVLICTTIVESGIDVPSANTIIIDRADTFGLAQLHQLRGRVGRSHHRAYAYMITPPKKLMTPDAIKRLEAIEASGELGAGFLLSSHDLEIRGAGELLGDEQSGQIQEIGLGMYTELLDRAVQAIRDGKEPALDFDMESAPEIELQLPALIPDDYLPDITSRLVLYKRIASAQSSEDLWALQVEMIDRFGLLPDQTRHLFATAELKLKAEILGIRKIEGNAQGLRFHFAPTHRIDPATVIGLIQARPPLYRLDGPDKVRYVKPLPDPAARLAAVDECLKALSPASTTH